MRRVSYGEGCRGRPGRLQVAAALEWTAETVADSTSHSKRAELQTLKDKMRTVLQCEGGQSTETDVAEVPMTLANSDSETEIEDEDVFRPMPLDAMMFQKNKAFLDMCGVGLVRKKSFVSSSASCASDVLALMCYVPLVGCGPHVFG